MSASIQFSYEFFPPRSPEMERRLWRTVGQLERLHPCFFSMTYGALGSAQHVSIESAIALHNETAVPLAAHLTCADAGPDQVRQVASRFAAAGIDRIVALRGDAAESAAGEARYAFPSALELVMALGEIGEFDISVAAYPEGHPQAGSPIEDLQHLRRKLDAGAARAITQYFFDADCYLRFRDRAARIGIDKPIVPGILPVHDLHRVKRFSARCGASVPLHYDQSFARVEKDPSGQYRLALDLAVELCERLQREGVQHFHLYTLNQTDICLDISLALGARLGAAPAAA